MRQQISFVNFYRLNDILSQTFGPGKFKVVIQKMNNSHKERTFYLEYTDATDEQISQALLLAQEDTVKELQYTKQRVYDKMKFVMDKLTRLNIKTSYLQEDVLSAENWLQDQTQPCPVAVLAIAMKDQISNIDAAQKMTTEESKNLAYKTALTQLFSDTVRFVAESNNADDCILKIQNNIELMRSIEL